MFFITAYIKQKFADSNLLISLFQEEKNIFTTVVMYDFEDRMLYVIFNL